MPAHEAVCRDCDWAQAAPSRSIAEHAGRVHEREDGHRVAVERIEG
ncbi:MAG: hypothetical protein ABEJ42_05785 [Halobacteriaceae archaeon]